MLVEDCTSTVEAYDDSVSSSLAFELDTDTEVASIEVMPKRKIEML